MMRYISVCSGIEAATAAWHSLGWEAAWYSEVDAFPSAVLAHHYPNTPNRGDMTKFLEWPDATVDLLVGGTPCQSFSVAGLRKGLADPRGNLMLTYLAIADQYRPRWLVWENVPGVLSSNGGRDFGTLLGGLGQLGYGFAYRVLDAQYFGVPQRRRRVFVVGCLGDWRRAAAVLFERHSLQGHPAPSRQAGERIAPCLDVRAGRSGETTFHTSGGLVHAPAIARCIATHEGSSQDYETTTMVAHSLRAQSQPSHRADSDTYIAHSLRGEGFDASEDGTGRGTPLVPVAFGWQNSQSQGDSASESVTPTLDKSKTPAIVYALGSHAGVADGDQTNRSHAAGGPVGSGISEETAYSLRAGRQQSIASPAAVRRLTPRECERLQGFDDDYTLIPYRGKAAADGPRYKALGNSMAVPVMRWIGERISVVHSLEVH